MTQSATILVVDDNLDHLAVMDARLTARGYNVKTASKGQDALSVIDTAPPDLVLLDVMMPDLDGIATLRRIKANHRAFIPVVLVSAKSDLQDVSAGLDAGADDYLAKPVQPVELYARVKSLLRMKALQDALTREAISAERMRILADMHDSVGSDITVMLSMLSATSPDLAGLRRRMQTALMELRLLIDTRLSEVSTLADVIANCRHRLGEALRLAGIKVDWSLRGDVEKLPIGARDALHLELIIAEAVSNILHHSAADRVEFGCVSQGRAIVFTIADNGRGFDQENASGRGLENMRRRAAQMSIGCEVMVDSTPGTGTIVQLDLQFNRQ